MGRAKERAQRRGRLCMILRGWKICGSCTTPPRIDRDHNIDADHIANVKENCEGKYLKVTAENDGSFTLTNQRTGVQKTYAVKK